MKFFDKTWTPALHAYADQEIQILSHNHYYMHKCNYLRRNNVLCYKKKNIYVNLIYGNALVRMRNWRSVMAVTFVWVSCVIPVAALHVASIIMSKWRYKWCHSQLVFVVPTPPQSLSTFFLIFMSGICPHLRWVIKIFIILSYVLS